MSESKTTDTSTYSFSTPGQLARVKVWGDPYRLEKRMERDAAFKGETIALASRIPDARGELLEIKDPHLRAAVADALDLSGAVKNAPALFDLAESLSFKYPQASDKVRKQAEYIARTFPNGRG